MSKDLFSRMFGRRAVKLPAKPPVDSGSSQSHIHSVNSQQSKNATGSASSTRRELLRVVLRDTLRRHGIPAEWITADMQTSISRKGGDPGIHWRLVIRHWDTRLPNHCVAFQNSLISRVQMFDPLAETWLTGITWQFALESELQCPPMPHPGMWTAPPHEEDTQPAAREAESTGDVIAGPVNIESHGKDVKADLERLMSVLDEQYHRADAPSAGYAPTEPAKL